MRGEGTGRTGKAAPRGKIVESLPRGAMEVLPRGGRRASLLEGEALSWRAAGADYLEKGGS